MVLSEKLGPESPLSDFALQQLATVRAIYEADLPEFDDFITKNALIKSALNIALIAHEEQTRDDGVTPYVNHPYEASLLAWKHLTAYNVNKDVVTQELLEEVVSTCLLHDVLEENSDHSEATLARLLSLGHREEEREARENRALRIAGYIAVLTPSKKSEKPETKKGWLMRKTLEAGTLITRSELIVNLTKTADILANATETLRNARSDAVGTKHSLQDRLSVIQARLKIIQTEAETNPLLKSMGEELEKVAQTLSEPKG
ncbi:MAG: hypothetical protein ACE5DQ_01930 [Candidatus Paceibacterota bacterium]